MKLCEDWRRTEAHGGGGVLYPSLVTLVASLGRIATGLTVVNLAARAGSDVRVVLRENP